MCTVLFPINKKIEKEREREREREREDTEQKHNAEVGAFLTILEEQLKIFVLIKP